MKKNKKILFVHALLVISIIFCQVSVRFGQSADWWKSQEVKYFEFGNKKSLKSAILPTSAFFIDDKIGWIVGSNGDPIQRQAMRAYTDDGGKAWQVSFSKNEIEYTDILFFSKEYGLILGVEANDQNEGYGVLLETTDSGDNWTKRKIGNFKSSQFLSLYFLNDKIGYLAGAIKGKNDLQAAILRTEDGGKSWNSVYVGKEEITLEDIKFDKQGKNGWAVGEKTLINSKDGGRTWQKSNLKYKGLGWLFKIQILDSQEVWVTASNNSLYHTTDGGNTWKIVSPKIDENITKDFAVWFSGIFFRNKEQGWIGGTEGLILKTNDGGENWEVETVEKADFIYEIVSVNGKLMAIDKEATLLQREFEAKSENK